MAILYCYLVNLAKLNSRQLQRSIPATEHSVALTEASTETAFHHISCLCPYLLLSLLFPSLGRDPMTTPWNGCYKVTSVSESTLQATQPMTCLFLAIE